MLKVVLVVIIGLLILTGIWIMWKSTSRSAYEAAAYQLVKSEGPCEIREYPELWVASTPMRSDASSGQGSFMRLFRYIGGDNADQRKVAMTVPVFMQPPEDSGGRMSFVLPRDFQAEEIPDPSHRDVAILRREPGTFAVIRFSGRPDQRDYETAERTLRSWMAEQGLTGAPEFEAASYDPPWTPGPFRRNEVLIRVVAADSESS